MKGLSRGSFKWVGMVLLVAATSSSDGLAGGLVLILRPGGL
jgi:hypothetical protein